MRFVGLAAYEAAGGYVRRDLFSDDEHAGYIAEADLLQRLVAQKLDAAAATVRAEGWGWTEMRVERDVLELNRYGRLRQGQRPYTYDEQREIDALTAQRTELSDKLDALPEDDEDAYEEAERLDAEIGSVETAIRALASCAIEWDASQMAESGAFVIVGPQGELVIERGLVRRENCAALDAAGATVTGTPEADAPDTTDPADAADTPAKAKPIHSATLCQRLSAHRTAAVHAELIAQPAVALAALLRHLIPQALPEHYRPAFAPRYLALTGDNNHDRLLHAADDLPVSPTWNAIETQRTRWIGELPANPADLLPWLLRQDAHTTLLDLLAFCTGTLLDGIATSDMPHAINGLADALNLDMTRYWAPTPRRVLRPRQQGAHRGRRVRCRVAQGSGRPRQDEKRRRGGRCGTAPRERGLVSSPRELHPEALPEPYVKLSPHTAPIIQLHYEQLANGRTASEKFSSSCRASAHSAAFSATDACICASPIAPASSLNTPKA